MPLDVGKATSFPRAPLTLLEKISPITGYCTTTLRNLSVTPVSPGRQTGPSELFSGLYAMGLSTKKTYLHGHNYTGHDYLGRDYTGHHSSHKYTGHDVRVTTTALQLRVGKYPQRYLEPPQAHRELQAKQNKTKPPLGTQAVEERSGELGGSPRPSPHRC